MPQAHRINEDDRVVRRVIVEIGAVGKPCWVLANEPSDAGIVVAGSVVIDSGLLIELAPGVLEWVCERPC